MSYRVIVKMAICRQTSYPTDSLRTCPSGRPHILQNHGENGNLLLDLISYKLFSNVAILETSGSGSWTAIFYMNSYGSGSRGAAHHASSQGSSGRPKSGFQRSQDLGLRKGTDEFMKFKYGDNPKTHREKVNRKHYRKRTAFKRPAAQQNESCLAMCCMSCL